ncbi:MAG: hypothetical protein ACI971_001701, partial [Colwellia sp.]
MSGFSVTVPQWNDIPQLSIIGLGALAENNKVKLVTEQGDLFISLLDIG